MSELRVHDLYRFIKEDVTLEKLVSASYEAFNEKAITADEGKVPVDPGHIDKPDEYIQNLSEEEKKEEKGEVKPAPVTEEPKKSELEKELDKVTPNVDKLSDFENAVKVNSDKEEKKEEVKVTGIDTEKEKKADEGKVPTDPGHVDKPDEYIQNLAEEKVLTTVSDEAVANDIASKYPGSRVVQDQQGKQWMVMVKEEKTSEPKEKAASSAVPQVDAKKDTDKLTSEKTVKEDVDVTVKTEDKEVNIVSTEGGTQVTTLDTATAPTDVVPVEVGPAAAEEPIVSEPEPEIEEPDYSDEETIEMAEKLFVVEYLSGLKKLTEKQTKFIDETKKKKMSKKNKEKVDKKLQALRDKKEKK